MSTVSNLYAEKVFSEHPIALWTLDDKSDYVSLISENQRNVSLWTPTDCTLSEAPDVIGEPFLESSVSRITGVVPPPNYASLKAIVLSDSILNFSDLNQELSTFSIGGYFYSESPYIASIDIGFQYFDTTQGQNIIKVKEFQITTSNQWMFLSETFDIPDENTTFKLLFRIRYLAGSDQTSDYQFLVNGVSVGQWSEEFQSVSLGVTPIAFPSSINLNGVAAIESPAYGLQNNSAYYLVSQNSIKAKNTGIPMVYGSSNITRLYSNNNLPSVIVPGRGMLNKSGQYNIYTLECWIRINSDAVVDKKIIGPIGSEDGIYVSGPFIKIKVGDSFSSHYVGEWARPMLLHFRVGRNSASLLINGALVAELEYITSELSLPEEYENDKSNDWIGFWAYEDVSPVEIDCVGIYPYTVAEVVAKRRFVYGQAVEIPENINTAYSGSSVFIDYPTADYTSNYSYPDIGKWNQGIRDNLVIENNIIYSPEYDLPEIVLSGKTVEQFYIDCEEIQNESELFYSIKKTPGENINGYLFFDKLQTINEPVRCIYGVFKTLVAPLLDSQTIDIPQTVVIDGGTSSESSTSLFYDGGSVTDRTQTLIRIQKDGSSDYFSIDIDGDSINYYIYSNGNKEIVYSAVGLQVGEKFTVGLDIDTFSSYYGGKVASFFGNRELLKVYVGGNRGLTSTFGGKIYSVGFCTNRNFSKIAELFNTRGVPLSYENVYELYENTEEIEYFAGFYNTTNWDAVIDGGNNNSIYFKPVQIFDEYGEPVLDENNNPTYNFVPTDISAEPWPSEYMPAAEMLNSHTASYTLIAKEYFNEFTLDVAVQGYWEDYVPLSHFAELVVAKDGDSYYDLDFIQLNIDYPAPSKFIQQSVEGEWSYEELESVYSNPIQRTYESLDNFLFTNYQNYLDLKNNSSKTFKYDTENSSVKSYVTFQYIETGANAPDGYFINTELAPKENVIDPDENWLNTKYEFVNNTIVYPPKTSNIRDLALVTHLEFVIDGIKDGRVGLRKLQMASQSFNQSTPNPIGTRFGNNIYPYRKDGVYFNYKSKNPFTIYKGQSPYLYLTRFSGIELKGEYDPRINRGISIPINQGLSDNYKLMAMQTAVRYDQDFFPYAPTQIFEVESENQYIKFFMIANQSDGKRAKIYAVNGKTGKIENGIAFYMNGKIVKEPTITIREWSLIGIGFSNLLDFSNSVGSIRLTGPITFNLISHYQSTQLQQVQSVATRPWFLVRGVGLSQIEWDFWNISSSWNNVLILSSTSLYGVDPSDIYASYAGTDKIIVDSGASLGMNEYRYSVYRDISWQQDTSNAV